MLVKLCICNHLPNLEVRTRLRLVIHRLESYRSSNSGQLAAKCIAGSEVLVHAERNSCLAPPWHELEGAVCLFPGDDAQPLHPEMAPATLFVPDATWRQAKKMMRKLPWLKAMKRVTVPADAAGKRQRMRRQRRPGEFATAEAIAMAIRVLDGDEAADGILHAFRLMTDRTLYSRGKLAAGEVYGGVPPS